MTIDTVNTIADLRKIMPSSGATLLVLGYHSPGDGGGGNFFWDGSFDFAATLDPNDPDYQDMLLLFSLGANPGENGGTVIKPVSVLASDPGRWRRVHDGSLSVKWFGATGGDAKTVNDGIIQIDNANPNAPLNKLKSGSGKFGASEEGKLIRIQGAGPSIVLCTTIAEVKGQKDVILKDPAITGVSGAKVVLGAAANAPIIYDGEMAAGSYALKTATSLFADSDADQPIFISGAGLPGVLLTTINHCQDEYNVELADAALNPVSGATVLWAVDDWRAIQAALYTCKSAGGEVYFPPGVYRSNKVLSAKFVSNAAITLRGVKGTVLDVVAPQDSPRGLLTVGGDRLLPATGLSLSAKSGDRTINFDTTALTVSPGDVLSISADALWEPYEQRPKGELVEVEEVAGAQVKLRSALFDSYDLPTHVYKLATPRVKVEDIEIRSDGPHLGLTVQYARDVEVNGCSCSGARYAAFQLRYVFGGIFTNNFAADFYVACLGANYGLMVSSSQYITTMGNRLFGGRHAITHGYREPVRCIVHTGNVIDNDHSHAVTGCLDIHANAEFIEVTGNIILNGVTCNGRNVAINHNLITAHDLTCIDIRPTQSGDYYRISNNQLLSDRRYGLVLGAQGEYVKIDGVYISGNIMRVSAEGIRVNAKDFTGLMLENVELDGNDVITPNGFALRFEGEPGKSVQIQRLAVIGGRYSGYSCFHTHMLEAGHLQMRGVQLVTTRNDGGPPVCLDSSDFADAIVEGCWLESEKQPGYWNTLAVSGNVAWINNVVKNFTRNYGLNLAGATLTFQNNTHYACQGALNLSGSGRVQSSAMPVAKAQTTDGTWTPVWTYTLSDNTLADIVASVLAHDSNGNFAAYKRRASVKRQQGGPATVIGVTDVVGIDKADVAGRDVRIQPGGKGEVQVQVRGLAVDVATDWFADVEVILFGP